MTVSLVLASSSPRRHELLRNLGLVFTVVAADIDETERVGELPVDYVGRVAREKAMTVVARIGASGDVVVLAADTTVDVDGAILGKPSDDADARRMLRLLSGRTHAVHTAVVGRRGAEVNAITVTTKVRFAELDESEIDWYIGRGEYLDKAGAYGMQGAGGALVAGIDGSPSNVIGLPLAETVGILRALSCLSPNSAAGGGVW